MKLTEGGQLIIPKGWTVEFDGNAVSIHHKHYMAGSRRSYAWFEFINEAHKAALKAETDQQESTHD